VNATYFGVRWQGQVQPQYSETYYFDVVADDGVMLWVNGQLVISSWSKVSGIGWAASRSRRVSFMISGWITTRLPPRIPHIFTGIAMTRRDRSSPPIGSILIRPRRRHQRLRADDGGGLCHQPFSFNVTASTSGGAAPTFGLGTGSGPLPPGLALNTATGLISGTATVVGNYQVALTASNQYGVGASVLDIQILPPAAALLENSGMDWLGPMFPTFRLPRPRRALITN